MKTYYVLVGFGLVLVFFIFYFLMAGLGGFSGPPASWESYGEEPVASKFIKQPIAFWTDLGFILSGLVALAWIDMSEERFIESVPMRAASVYSVPLGLIMVWMGPASMFEHGLLLTNWGWLDATSIHWYALFVVLYLGLRWIPGASATVVGKVLFFAVYVIACVVIGVLTWQDEGVREPVSIGLMVTLGVAYLASLTPTLVRQISGKNNPFIQFHWSALWLAVVALVLFGAALAFLFTGASGGETAPWGHGAFHLCVAATTFVIYWTLRLELPRKAASGRGGDS